MEILKRIFVITVLFIASVNVLHVFTLQKLPDFTVYYYGSKAFLSGENPYITGPKYFSNYVYPPFVLLFFLPLAMLPEAIASSIWITTSFACLIGSLFLISRIHKSDVLSNKSLLFISFAMLAFPVKFTLGMGQINLFILFIFLLGITYYLKGKKEMSGIFFGLTLALKFFPVLLLIYFLFRKEWKVFIYSCGMFVLLYLFTLFFTGFDSYVFYITQIMPGIFSSAQTAYYNQALSGVIARQIGELSQGGVIKLIISGVLVFITFLILTRTKKISDNTKFLEISLITIVSLLVHSFSWQHHFVWLLLPFSVVLSKKIILTKKMLICLFTSAFLIAINIKNPQTLPVLAQSHVFFGTLLLWVFFVLLLHNKSYAK